MPKRAQFESLIFYIQIDFLLAQKKYYNILGLRIIYLGQY
jgi:hypothetical protein